MDAELELGVSRVGGLGVGDPEMFHRSLVSHSCVVAVVTDCDDDK